MRICVLVLVALWVGAGCRSGEKKDAAAARGPGEQPRGQLTPIPVLPLAGKVASVNSQLRFVVLDFSLGGMPRAEQILSVYHQGQKVAEVRVSGPQLGAYIAADVVAGLVQVGDEVRLD